MTDTTAVPPACPVCQTPFDPAKDSFVTFHERKGPSIDLCSAS